eukprot:TRINITY_DN5749_c0_g1_i4.p1 TRINITY_DN5749_c0_g1~~TRINITY_DN5749_c0_g1_i4.p1  ORF type:complete len:2411 (-),score=860.18 TRINITY_DN5749_c0_g1_i4:389-7621(-)
MGEFTSFLLRVVYPSILFGASIGRVFNLISAFYFCGFVSFAVWATQRSARNNGRIAKLLVSTFFVISGLTTLGGAVFSVVNAIHSGLDPDIVSIFNIIGFEPIIKSKFVTLRFFLSDVVVFVCSFALLYKISRGEHFARATNERISKSSNFNALINVALLFVISAAYPSVLNLVYIVLFLLFVFTYRWFSITEINSKIWPVILVYNGLHLSALYAFQWQLLQDKTPSMVKNLLGILDYTKVSPSMYPMFVAYAGIALQFMLLCHWFAVFRTYKDYKSQMERKVLIGKKSSWLFMVSTRFYLNHGWKICMFISAIDFFFLPSVLTIGVLLNLCFGIMKPKSGGKAAPLMLYYFGTVILAEWIYNIPYNWRGRDESELDRNDLLLNIGMTKFPSSIFHIGIHLTLLWLVSLYWRIHGMKDVINSHHFENLAAIAKETPVMTKPRRLRRRSDHSNFNNITTIRSIGEKTKEKTTNFFTNQVFPFIKGIVIRIIRFFLQNSYVISLAGLCISALQATNLLNTGYMVFFIVFLISRGLAEQIWLAVVFYSQGIILALSVWQIPATGSPGNDSGLAKVIGLIHYPKNVFWFRMIPNIIAMMFTVLQWHLIKYRLKQSKASKRDSIIPRPQSKTSIIARFLTFVDLVSEQFYAYSLLISYLVLLAVAIFDNFSAVSIMYMLFFFTFSLLHMVSEHALTFVKALWGVAVVLSAAVLIARYVYQFELARDWVKEWYPKDIGITLIDLGLVDFGSNLVIRLAGNIIVLITFVFQARVFISYSRERRDPIEKLLIRSRITGSWPTIVAVSKRILARLMPIVTTFTLFFIVVKRVTFINLLYFFGLIISNFLPRGPDSMGLLYLLLVEFIVMSKMLCRFSYFSKFDVEKNYSLLKWIGLPYALNGDSPLWSDLGADMIVMILLIICRVTSRWVHPKEKKEKAIKSSQEISNSPSNSSKEDENMIHQIITMDSPSGEEEVKEEVEVRIIDIKEIETNGNQENGDSNHSQEGLRNRRVSQSNGIPKEEEEEEEKIDYAKEESIVEKETSKRFKRIRWYTEHFFVLWGYEIFFLVGLLSLILRNDYLGIVYILFIGIQNRFGRAVAFGAAFPLFLLFLVFVLASEYVFLLRAPPVKPEGLTGELQYIWEAVPMRWWDWLTLRNPIFQFSMTFDFLLFFIAAKLAFISKADKLKLFEKKDEMRDRNAKNFEMDPYNGGRWIQFLIFRFSADVILVIIFIIGALQVNVLRFGYIFFSLYLLINNEAAFTPQSKGWSWLRVYTFALITIEIFYQVPIVKEFVESHQFPDILLGLKPMSNDMLSLIFDQGITQDVFILMLLWAQKRIGKRPEIQTVNKIVEDYEEHAYIRAKHYYEEQRKYEKMKLFRAQKEQSERWARLIAVKNRHKEIYFEKRDAPTSPSLIDSPSVTFTAETQPEPPKEEPVVIQVGVEEEKLEPVSLDNEELKKAVEDEDQLEKMRHKAIEGPIIPSLNIVQENEEMEEGLLADTEEANTGIFYKRLKRFLTWIKEMTLKISDIGIYTMEGVVKYKKEKEWLHLSRKKRFINILGAVVQQQSKKVAFLFFFINHLLYANIFSLVFPLAAFGYGMMLQGTRPTKRFWNFILVYTSIIIFIKFVFFLKIFCIRGGDFEVYTNCLNPVNQNPTTTIATKIGLDDYFANDKDETFFNLVLGDLLIFLAVLWHRNVMRVNGLWDYNSKQEQMAEKEALERSSEIVDPRRSHLKRSNSSSRISIVRAKSHSRSSSLEGGTTPSPPSSLSIRTIPISRSSPDVLVDSHVSSSPSNPLKVSDIPVSEEEEEEQIEVAASVGSNNSENSLNLEDENLIHRRTENNTSDEEYEEDLFFYSQEAPKPNPVFKFFHDFFYHPFVSHYDELTVHKSGSDYYTAILFSQLLVFLYLVFFQVNLTKTDSGMVISMFVNGSIPGSYLSYLFQFAFILIDRTIYLFRSVRAKVAFQYFQLFVIHTVLFFVLQFKPHNDPVTYKFNVILYMLEGLYLTLSAMQIANGYPPTTHDQFLTKKADTVREFAFIIYRALPFVFELKTLLDFMVRDTTLFFRDYLKLEDLYGELFLVKCDQEYRQQQKRKVGEKQPILIKFFQGFVLFIGLIALIWFPLILLSSWVPSDPNFVTSASLKVGFKGAENLFVSSNAKIVGAKVNDPGIPNISVEELKTAQMISFEFDSENLWQPTPVSLQSLKDQMQNFADPPRILITLSVSRETKPSITTTLVKTFEKAIPITAQNDFVQMLDNLNTNRSIPIEFNGFFDQNTFNVPSNGEITYALGTSVNVNMFLNNTFDYQWWWKMEQSNGDQIRIWTLSAKVPTGITAKLASAGLVGLYVGVVLSVGRFLRLWVSSLVARIWLDDMPTTDRLMTMCEDIFIARQYNDLMLEEHLYKELIQLLRDPHRIIDITKKEL